MTADQAYRILNVSPGASLPEVERAYTTVLRALQLQMVPSQPLAIRQKAQEQIAQLKTAFELLKNTARSGTPASPVGGYAHPQAWPAARPQVQPAAMPHMPPTVVPSAPPVIPFPVQPIGPVPNPLGPGPVAPTYAWVIPAGLALSSVICCSGNGHYVLAPIVPIAIDSADIAAKYERVCQNQANAVAGQVEGVRFDDVFNPSRVMRVMDTWNRKGQPAPGRPHRRACFVTDPTVPRSMMLHYMILNADADPPSMIESPLPTGLRCDLRKIEDCQFITYCRQHAGCINEPQWVAMVSNLVHLEGGIQLAHEISRLDERRYCQGNTQRLIERLLREKYHPAGCRAIAGPQMARPGRGVFHCSQMGRCPAKAPMYMAVSHIIYNR